MPWDIVWVTDPPDTQTYDIEENITTWNIRAEPDIDPGDASPEPEILSYEVVNNDFRDTLIVDVDLVTGVTITGNVGNPFPFVNIAYVAPKGTGTDKFSVGFVDDLPEDGDYDLYEWIQSGTTTRSDFITIRVTSTANTLEDDFEMKTNNNWTNGRDTLLGLL